MLVLKMIAFRRYGIERKTRHETKGAIRNQICYHYLQYEV